MRKGVMDNLPTQVALAASQLAVEPGARRPLPEDEEGE